MMLTLFSKAKKQRFRALGFCPLQGSKVQNKLELSVRGRVEEGEVWIEIKANVFGLTPGFRGPRKTSTRRLI